MGKPSGQTPSYRILPPGTWHIYAVLLSNVVPKFFPTGIRGESGPHKTTGFVKRSGMVFSYAIAIP
jgi:hypothetical protein